MIEIINDLICMSSVIDTKFSKFGLPAKLILPARSGFGQREEALASHNQTSRFTRTEIDATFGALL